MALSSRAGLPRTRHRHMYGYIRGTSFRNFSSSASRLQEDAVDPNLLKRFQETGDSESPVRLNYSRDREHRRTASEDQQFRYRLPENPNNARDPPRRKQQYPRGPKTLFEETARRFEPTSDSPKSRNIVPDSENQPNWVGAFIDNQPRQFSPILLRDLCTCASCVDSSTQQKLFSTADIPSDIKARAVAQDAEGLSIVWENDVPGYDQEHSTYLEFSVLRRIVNTGAGPSHATDGYHPGKQTIWDAAQYRQLADIDYEAYMQDNSTLFRALHQLHKYGMLFLTNVPEDEKSVSTIAERIGPVKNTFYGYTWDVRSVPEAKNVAYTSQDLGFHMDLLYMHQPPHLQFLHCIRSSAAGGASLFADSYKAAADLFAQDPMALVILGTQKTSFHYNHPSSHLYHQSHRVVEMQAPSGFTSFTDFARTYQRLFHLQKRSSETDAAMDHIQAFLSREQGIEDLIQNVAWSPPFQAPFQVSGGQGNRSTRNSEGKEISLNKKIGNWHRAAKLFTQLIHREEGMYERMMGPGECVIFDNRRVLHARRAFEVGDAGKERWLRGAYLDWDPYWSKMKVLGREYGKAEVKTAGESEANKGSRGARGFERELK